MLIFFFFSTIYFHKEFFFFCISFLHIFYNAAYRLFHILDLKVLGAMFRQKMKFSVLLFILKLNASISIN